MTAKSDELVDELVSAAIAFGRGQLPDWQTRIEDARRELRAYIEGLEPRWIPVSERLPKIYQAVNVVDAGEFIKGIWDGEMFEVSADHQSDFGASHFENVTHWMPLPEAPEVQESEATSCEYCGSNKFDRRMNSIVCADCGRKVGNIASPEADYGIR